MKCFFMIMCTFALMTFAAMFIGTGLATMRGSFLTGLIGFIIGVALLGASCNTLIKAQNIAKDELSKDPAYVEYDGKYYEKIPILSADEKSDVFVLERNSDKYIITEDTDSDKHKVSIWINYAYISTEENLTEPYMFEANGKTYVVVPSDYVERVIT